MHSLVLLPILPHVMAQRSLYNPSRTLPVRDGGHVRRETMHIPYLSFYSNPIHLLQSGAAYLEQLPSSSLRLTREADLVLVGEHCVIG